MLRSGRAADASISRVTFLSAGVLYFSTTIRYSEEFHNRPLLTLFASVRRLFGLRTSTTPKKRKFRRCFLLSSSFSWHSHATRQQTIAKLPFAPNNGYARIVEASLCCYEYDGFLAAPSSCFGLPSLFNTIEKMRSHSLLLHNHTRFP